MPVWAPGDAHDLLGLLSHCFDSIRGLASPFESYLEAPAAITSLYQEHGREIRAGCDDLSERFRRLLTDVAHQMLASVSPEVVDKIHRAIVSATQFVVTADVLTALEETDVWKAFVERHGPQIGDRLREALPLAIGASAESVPELAREAAERVYPQNMGGGVPFDIWLALAKLAKAARSR